MGYGERKLCGGVIEGDGWLLGCASAEDGRIDRRTYIPWAFGWSFQRFRIRHVDIRLERTIQLLLFDLRMMF